MDKIVSRCGFRCDRCPAFTGNNKTFSDQLKTAAGWLRYFDLKMPPDRIRCNGCLSLGGVPTEQDCGEYELPDPDCPIVSCVKQHRMNTCGDCFDYPCKTLLTRMKPVDKAILKFKDKVSQEEYDLFIAPYDYRQTLDSIRDRRVDRID
jgi:hypothetical protein